MEKGKNGREREGLDFLFDCFSVACIHVRVAQQRTPSDHNVDPPGTYH